MPVAMPVRKQN